jgi:hypothetical protein
MGDRPGHGCPVSIVRPKPSMVVFTQWPLLVAVLDCGAVLSARNPAKRQIKSRLEPMKSSAHSALPFGKARLKILGPGINRPKSVGTHQDCLSFFRTIEYLHLHEMTSALARCGP